MSRYSGREPDAFNMSELAVVLLKISGALAVGYAIAAVGAHFLSLRMIFPRPPVSYALTPDYIQLAAPDGIKLAARHWPNPDAKYTVLFLHGNYEDLGTVGEYVPQFVASGYAVFALDYRRYGQSGGTPTEANTCADVELAYRHLRETLRVPADRIVVFGYSLGSGPAIDLLLHQPAAGLVLQGAFVSTYRVMTRIPLFPGDKFANLAKVPRLELPVLVIHGTADRTVPVWHGQALYEAITARKMKLLVEGGPHSRLEEFAGKPYWEKLREFTDSL